MSLVRGSLPIGIAALVAAAALISVGVTCSQCSKGVVLGGVAVAGVGLTVGIALLLLGDRVDAQVVPSS